MARAPEVDAPAKPDDRAHHGTLSAVSTQRPITALSGRSGMSEELWMNLPSNRGPWIERRALRDRTAAITPLPVA